VPDVPDEIVGLFVLGKGKDEGYQSFGKKISGAMGVRLSKVLTYR